ncbi:hypothetical protein A4A49_51166 [Nicotiana attenuata]|uniref:F-box associated beta-propeller type 1 domain-containing protein n=1 Tax=Nicotiana attenuata TaxID=49451 RepID=A0A314L0E9_NICAT|nr:hypothetical protein A4A49_51166 [Nicotiana attenuata]
MVFKLYEERKKGYSESTAFRFINQQLTLRERKFPFVIRDNKIISGTCMFLGSCHGLILVNINEHIYLWNPATRFCTKVLELDRLDECGYCTHGGLCFDSSKNVYKVVLIMHHQTPDYGGEFVIVASLKDKIWKRVKFPYNIRSRVRVKKPYNREAESMWDSFGPRNEIIYFDPISEKFYMFPVPEPKSDQEENAIIGLGVLDDCLSMTCLKDDKVGVEILVMNEYGILVHGKEVSMDGTISYVESLISPNEYYWSRKRHRKFGKLV